MYVTHTTDRRDTIKNNAIIAIAACTTGTETTVENPAVGTVGLPLEGVAAIVISLQATNASTGDFFAAGNLRAYLYLPYLSAWIRVPDMDLNVAAGVASQCWTSKIPAHLGNLVWLPDSVGVPVTVTLFGTFAKGVVNFG